MIISKPSDLLYHQRILAKCEPAFRACLVRCLHELVGTGKPMNMDTISEAISLVFDELTSYRSQFSDVLEATALQEFHNSDCITTKEWVDELRDKLT